MILQSYLFGKCLIKCFWELKFCAICNNAVFVTYNLDMKKKIILSLTLIFILIVSSCLLFACDKKPDSKVKNNVSRETNAFYAGENEKFAVSVEVGRREKTFIADGKTTDVIDFADVTVTPLKTNSYETVNFVISGSDESTLSGEIAKSNYGEFVLSVDLKFAPTKISVTAGEDSAEIELKNVLEGKITSSDAVNVAKDAFKDKIEAEANDGKPEREIYVKLISGDRQTYYYYVSFIGDGVDYWAVLIDPTTGSIISKR